MVDVACVASAGHTLTYTIFIMMMATIAHVNDV